MSPGSTLHALLLQRSRPSPPACRSLPRALPAPRHWFNTPCAALSLLPSRSRQGGGQVAARGKDIRGAGRRHHPLVRCVYYFLLHWVFRIVRLCKTYEVQDGDIIHWCVALLLVFFCTELH